MNNKYKNMSMIIDDLFEAILKLDSVEECYSFFEDLCTFKEIESLSHRLLVAKMLDDNITYLDIEKQTGVSASTISRVNRALKYGKNGYRLILDRINKDD